MADEVQTAPPAEASDATTIATPQSDPTPTQTDSQAFTASIDADIESLWAQFEGRAPKALLGEAAPEPAADTPPPETAKAEAPKAASAEKPAESPKAEDASTDDPAALRVKAYEEARAKVEAEERAKVEADARVRAEQAHRRQYEAYVGPDDAYAAVNSAIRASLAGDRSALDALDVVLPNGKTVSEVKGEKGLTQEEASNLLTAWDSARRYEDVMGDRKVSRILDLWNSSVMRVLADPDVDAAAVTKHANPDQQMEALRESVRERVTKRLTEAHEAEKKTLQSEIEKLTQRVSSLTNERGNLTSQRQAAEAASVDRPGQPGALRPAVPTPEELAAMPAEEALKYADRILSSIPGGLSPQQRLRRVS